MGAKLQEKDYSCGKFTHARFRRRVQHTECGDETVVNVVIVAEGEGQQLEREGN